MDLRSRKIGAQFATEKDRWRMRSCASSRVLGMDREFSDQGTNAETRKRNERVFWFNVGYGACTFGLKQPESRSSFVAILPCAAPVGMPIPLYLHPASKHPPDTDPSINNSDKPQPGEGPRLRAWIPSVQGPCPRGLPP